MTQIPSNINISKSKVSSNISFCFYLARLLRVETKTKHDDSQHSLDFNEQNVLCCLSQTWFEQNRWFLDGEAKTTEPNSTNLNELVSVSNPKRLNHEISSDGFFKLSKTKKPEKTQFSIYMSDLYILVNASHWGLQLQYVVLHFETRIITGLLVF